MPSKNTKPELLLRSFLTKLGRRYRIHMNTLPGKPDIVFTKQRLIVFVHGCYWHRHASCAGSRQIRDVRDPEWASQFNQNVLRDKKNISLLETKGWKVHVSWECQINEDALGEARKIDKILKSLEAIG
jgi:DNA mismatch endonuclease (patch repair protein)